MRILLAVSGGIDSMYMLHRAPELFPGASFAVAHCNFCLRGADSDGDEAFVAAQCAALGTECFVKRFDTAGYASGHGISIEMAARELRYGWFGELCAGQGFDALATAHNANDNAETLILNLLRGSGTKGLRGMEASRDLWYPAIPGTTSAGTADHPSIIRPLLNTSRSEILSWMEARGFAWREDRTNAGSDIKRNKIRNLVFPVFAEINPSFIKTLGEDIQRFRQTDDIAEDYFREAAACMLKYAPEADGEAILEISVKDLLALGHWRYVLWRALEDYGFSAPTFGKLCALLERYGTEPSGTVTLSGKVFQSPTHCLRCRKKKLLLYVRNLKDHI